MSKQSYNHNGYLTGQILVSCTQSHLHGIYDVFNKSVILLCAHDENGAMGLVLNKLESVCLNDLLLQMEMPTMHPSHNPRIHSGGIIDNTHGFILHDTSYTEEHSATVSGLFSLTATTDILEKIAINQGPEHYMIALGYAGWKNGQLESEIANNDWLVMPASHAIVFDTPVDTMWYTILSQNSIDVSKLIHHNGRA